MIEYIETQVDPRGLLTKEVLPSRNIKFACRVEDKDAEPTACEVVATRWQVKTLEDFAKDKRCIFFFLPGAFTPTCSTEQLPAFEEMYDEFIELGFDKIYCVSGNDAFVMNAWGESLGIKKVELIPDGNLTFTSALNADVQKDNLGFHSRPWRFAIATDENMVITHKWVEPGMSDNCKTDPYGVSDPENILYELRAELEEVS